MQRSRSRLTVWTITAASAAFVACGADGPAAPTPSGDFVVSGTVVDRIAGGAIDGSTITFIGPVTRNGTVTNGSYQVGGLASGLYTVAIDGPQHVQHKTLGVGVYAQESRTFGFDVLVWGAGRFGVSYDDTFHRFFHQLARVRVSGVSAIGKWASPPTELYLVEGTVPDEQFHLVSTVLAEVNNESVQELWCGTTGPLRITIGPDPIGETTGRIVVRPNWDGSASGTIGSGNIWAGAVTINTYVGRESRLRTRDELKSGLLHELFHVAGAYHVCGGGLGENPFGFSRTNCPYRDSVMANLGEGPVTTLSPQDRLAACIIYHPGTLPGNTLPDTNPGYVPR